MNDTLRSRDYRAGTWALVKGLFARLGRSRVALLDTPEPERDGEDVAPVLTVLPSSDVQDKRAAERRIPISRHAATLSIHEFVNGGITDWEWSFQGGAFGVARTRESALTAAFAEIGVNVVFHPLTTDANCEFVFRNAVKEASKTP